MAHTDFRARLAEGQVIPAAPLALRPSRRWDERRQRALFRYYLDAGAGGLAVGVHSTQFAIRDPKVGLYRPVLALASEIARARSRPPVLVAGVIGRTRQALREAAVARELGYDAALLGLGAWSGASDAAMLRHCRRIAETIPIVGFYLQEAAGGRVLGHSFWRGFAEIDGVVAIKIAPFNRYRTLDVVRAVAESGREDIALYTGNDDHILGDLLTPFAFGRRRRFIVGGLLGQWGVWTKRAVEMLEEIRAIRGGPPPPGPTGPGGAADGFGAASRVGLEWLQRNAALTDANAALFDAANGFAGCLPGIHEVLRRQGLLESTACLDPKERLSPGQSEEITRVIRAYPWLTDDGFVRENLDRWLA